MTNTNHTAAQPLDLDRLQVISDLLYKRDSFAISAELNEMIAQARAARLDTTASASQPSLDAILNCYSPDDTVSDYQDKIRTLYASPVAAQQAAAKAPAAQAVPDWMLRSLVADLLHLLPITFEFADADRATGNAVISKIRAILAASPASTPEASQHADDEFAPYLKEGETPIERLKREIGDNEALTRLLAKERATVAAPSEPVAYVNGDELDNMLDDRTATIQTNPSGWRRTPLYRAAPTAAAATTSEDAHGGNHGE